MNNSTYRFTLDLQKHQSQMSVAVFRHDTAVRLIISLTDGGKPYFLEDGCYARLFGKRPDDAEFSHPCMIKDNTEIIYDFLPSASYVEGIVNCQLRIYGTEREFITAPRFTIVVDERVVDDSDTDIDDETLAKLDDIFASEVERIEAEKKRKGAYIRYSQHPDGTDFTEDWSEGYNYVGFATAKECPTEKEGFTWCLFKGNKGDQGEQGIPGEKGEKGEKGDLPERGVDYFTEDDKSAMLKTIMEAVGCPVYGILEGSNHIALYGKKVPVGAYTCSFVMEDDTRVPIGSFEKTTGVTEEESTYNGYDVYKEFGYTDGLRQSASSGQIKGENGYVLSGAVPLTKLVGKTITLRSKGLDNTGGTGVWAIHSTNSDTSASAVKNGIISDEDTRQGIQTDYEVIGDVTVATFEIPTTYKDYYFRFSSKGSGATATLTIDKVIS